jgi:vancomycin resistance protein YoaR
VSVEAASRTEGASRADVRARRRRRERTSLQLQRALAAALLIALLGLVLGLVFAGSPSRIAEGVEVAGVDVGGLSPDQARALLERRAAALAATPVVFSAAGRTWRFTPGALGVHADWRAAVDSALQEGSGVGPLRGLRRLEVRVLGAEIAPAPSVSAPALRRLLGRLDAAVSRPHRDARIRLAGLRPVVVHARAGRRLDRREAAATIVRALAALQREPVALPVDVDRPVVTAERLAPAAAQVRTALSGPVRLALGPTRWRLPRWRIADLLALPRDGETVLRLSGSGADGYFGRLQRAVDHTARDADFVITTNGVRVRPARIGVTLDVRATANRLLAAALSPTQRTVRLAVTTTQPERSTAEARAMGITGLVGTYETIYGGDANRIHNVQLVAHLVDRQVIAPGAKFSFNKATGERTAERGFREAPVIINGELQTGLGGGVCQVSTTVFNAAYEAGLPITARTNHALYISHYPQGRDATVNYPDVDLEFVNDTGHWLLLRTFVGSSSLVVTLYGAPSHRRVETQTAPLVELSPPPVVRVPDPELEVGQTVVEDSGEPARSTSVRRRVFAANGKLLLDSTWKSSYRSEPEIVRVGTKPKPEPPPPTKPKSEAPAQPKQQATEPPPTTTSPTSTTPTTTTSAPGLGITP